MQLLYLLNKGEVVYDGQASAIVDYMERIGIKINYNMNPADFFMLEISAMKELQGHTTLLNVDSWKQNRTEKNIL